MRRIVFVMIVLVGMLSLNSCLVSKKVVYFEDMETGKNYDVLPIPPLKVQKNDRVSIQVSSKRPELAAPFNSNSGVYRSSEPLSGDVKMQEQGYLVDQMGNIDFPILGTINVEGMTLDGLRDLIVDKLVKDNLINSPVVKVELLNMRIIILGETRNTVVNAPDGRMTILQALAQGQGVGDNANTKKIAVIREEEGGRKVYYNNLESKDIFDSPTYYLQQNDIVYIEPLASKARGDEARTWRIMGMITSLVTVGVTTWALLNK